MSDIQDFLVLVAPKEDSKPLPQKQRIKALLAIRGISQISVARKYQFQRSEVSRVISGDRRTRHIQEAIASEVGMSLEDLFPTS